MNSGSAVPSQGCLRQLYSTNNCEVRQPVLQLLAFEESESNDKQITLRLSDGSHFVDCTLSGNYHISGPVICETKLAATLGSFRALQLVRLVDYFSKNDESRICRLKIIVRRMVECGAAGEVIGQPLEIQQAMINLHKNSGKSLLNASLLQSASLLQGQKQLLFSQSQSLLDKTVKKNRIEELMRCKNEPPPVVKLENQVEAEQNEASQTTRKVHYLNLKSKREPQEPPTIKPTALPSSQGPPESLTHNQIREGKEGHLIARLIRFKTTRKDTKDGPMTVCYLGLLDKHGQLIRIHLAGRIAMSNEKTLKKGSCYIIRGFDLVSVRQAGQTNVQIRLKEKEYRITETINEELTRGLGSEYYRWDHEHEEDDQYVDVFGVVEDIEERTDYSPQDSKSVIRVVLRNRLKCVRISFWTDQFRTLESFHLQRGEAIVIEDVRKKQSKYYDFGFESNLVQLTTHPALARLTASLMPAQHEEREPGNIRQLLGLFGREPTNGRLRSIEANLIHCQDRQITFRFCEDCRNKKKIERTAEDCLDCGSKNLAHKFNLVLEFADPTASLTAVLFDNVAQKLLARTANEVSQMPESEVEHIFDPFLYRPFLLSLENRNQRLILRSLDPLPPALDHKKAQQNLTAIHSLLGY